MTNLGAQDDRVWLRLEDERAEDKELIVRLLSQVEIAKYLDGMPWPFTAEHYRPSPQIRTPQLVQLRWMLGLVGSDQPLGMIGLSDRDMPRPSLAYFLDAKVHGQGIMTRAVRLVCQLAFGTLGLKVLSLEAYEDNYPSLKIAAKCGFEPNGTSTAICEARGNAQVTCLDFLLTREAYLKQDPT